MAGLLLGVLNHSMWWGVSFQTTKVNFKVLLSFLIQQISSPLRFHASLWSEVCRAVVSDRTF